MAISLNHDIKHHFNSTSTSYQNLSQQECGYILKLLPYAYKQHICAQTLCILCLIWMLEAVCEVAVSLNHDMKIKTSC